MRHFKKFLFAVAITASALSGLYAHNAKAKERPEARFGACYNLYDCFGGSIGNYEEEMCRGMGGHSMNSGGVCFNL